MAGHFHSTDFHTDFNVEGFVVFHADPSGLANYDDGEQITIWPDISGNKNHALAYSLITAALLPTGTPNIIAKKAARNGLDAVQLLGDPGEILRLTTEHTDISPNRFVICVFEVVNTLLRNVGGASQQPYLDLDAAVFGRFSLEFENFGDTFLSLEAQDSTPETLAPVPAPEINYLHDEWAVVALEVKETTARGWLNSVLPFATDTNSAYTPTNWADGRQPELGRTQIGHISEVIVYEGTLTDASILSLFTRIAQDYAISVTGAFSEVRFTDENLTKPGLSAGTITFDAFSFASESLTKAVFTSETFVGNV